MTPLHRRRALIGCALGLTAWSAASTASAAVIQFGTKLEDTPLVETVNTSCSTGTWWYGSIGNILSPASTGSCQFTALGFAGGTTFGLNTPANGVATAARIKVGAVTGPMRINVVRTLFQQTGSAANPIPSPPFLQAYGPTFTPAANAITTVPLNLPMRAQASPDINDTSSVSGVDWLALEVLSSSVPVPLVASPGAIFFAAFPGPTASGAAAPGANALPNYGQIGLVLAMNADLTTPDSPTPKPSPTVVPVPPGGGGGGGGGAVTSPTIALGKPSAAVTGGRAAIELLCQVADCAGLITLQRATTTAKKTSAKAAVATTSLGKTRFSGKAGQKVKVRVTLNSRGKALLKGKRKVKVQASIALDGAAAPTLVDVTLRR